MNSFENRRYLSVKEAANEYFEKLISVSALYNLINKGVIKTIKLGNKTLIPVNELNQYCGHFLNQEVLWNHVVLLFTLLTLTLIK